MHTTKAGCEYVRAIQSIENQQVIPKVSAANPPGRKQFGPAVTRKKAASSGVRLNLSPGFRDT
jgi:hypothetical protein